MMLRVILRATCVAGAVGLFLVWPLAHAAESRADLGVTLRVIGTVHESGKSAGIARIEVAVDAFRATEILSIEVLGASGEPWLSRSGLVRTSDLAWSDATGRKVDATPEGPRIAARGLLKTRIEVPLEGASVHEVVVRVTGRSGDEVLSAEDAVRIPLDVPPTVVDDGTYANVPVQEVP